VIADGLAFAVRVGGQIHGLSAFSRLLQFRDELLFPLDDFVVRPEAAFDVDSQVLLGQVLNVAQGSLDHILLAQILADGFRLRRRFDDDEILSHKTP